VSTDKKAPTEKEKTMMNGKGTPEEEAAKAKKKKKEEMKMPGKSG
jgi:hypothetical protein